MQENHYVMKILTLKIIILLLLFITNLTNKIYAQTSNINVSQDIKFEELLNEKRKMNGSTTNSDRFRLQIFNGDSETAKNTLSDFKKNYKYLDGTIVFFTPIYKVWVGNFKTRIEAEKNLLDLKKKYPSIFLIKPNK